MTQPLSPNFDPVARIYRFAEYLTLGPLLQRTRTHFLPQLTECRRVLALGDGDGRFLSRLLQQNHGLQAVAVDTSAIMLHLLRQRCQPHASRLETLQASALDLFHSHETSPSGRIAPLEKERTLAPDLITTHFFLDCLTQPQLNTLTQTLAAHTAPGTLWLLSDFGPPHPRLLRPFAALYLRSLYFAFRILTGLRVTHLPNPQSALTAAGFDRIARHDLLHGFLYTEIWKHR